MTLLFNRPGPERREESLERMQFQHEPVKMVSNAGPGGTDSTLTAASLIDAIITHQINQSSNPNENVSAVPRSDALFQNVRYRRNASPIDPGQKERHDDSGPPPPSSHSSHPAHPHSQHSQHLPHPSERHGPPPGLHPSAPSVKSGFTLGEHIESIITKDFHQGSASGNVQDGVPEWRDMSRSHPWPMRSEYPKARIPETGSNDYSKNRSGSLPVDFTAKNRTSMEGGAPLDYGPPGRGPSGESNSRQDLSPYDYVKKKIVEVMRTSSDSGAAGSGANSEMAPPNSPARARGVSPAPSPNKRPRMNPDGEERGGPSPSSAPQPPPHYLSAPYPTMGYPFLPPNIPISSSASATAPTSSSTGNQPVVVMSSQYEPLSDED